MSDFKTSGFKTPTGYVLLPENALAGEGGSGAGATPTTPTTRTSFLGKLFNSPPSLKDRVAAGVQARLDKVLVPPADPAPDDNAAKKAVAQTRSVLKRLHSKVVEFAVDAAKADHKNSKTPPSDPDLARFLDNYFPPAEAWAPAEGPGPVVLERRMDQLAQAVDTQTLDNLMHNMTNSGAPKSLRVVFAEQAQPPQ